MSSETRLNFGFNFVSFWVNSDGFHKVCTVESGCADVDKEEMEFCHTFFQREHPEDLKNIKRKGTITKFDEGQDVFKYNDLSRVLTDVKHLRGLQSGIVSQLSAMKQENTMLWKELALLRHKDMKQQQIVDKVIQFLVTLIQPNHNSRMGRGGKRIPLVLQDSPNKRLKIQQSIDCQPSIRSSPIEEFENYFHNRNDFLVPEDDVGQTFLNNIESSVTSNNGADNTSDYGESSDFSGLVGSLDKFNIPCKSTVKDASNTYNLESNQADMQVTTNNQIKLNSRDNLFHLDETESELEQLKNILNSYNTSDDNPLLNLLKDEHLE
ncbi:heat shock factor protein 1-like isoform X2 [Sitophilus oryzae]|uniref:Heat shock factor protein 1-like isoform X2 n=1 Tax=Sitophilus oryzae TaxID=7048 RepID=A0A6J2XZ99_SITOR|nr:heat shock factor protein 1-like isoform X2 [Sitophilus oryzae]